MQRSVQEALGYDQSANFVRAASLTEQRFFRYRHIFSKAHKLCGLEGVYLLKDHKHHFDIPIVFYCKADNEKTARKFHRLIWNQDIVPFILIETPKSLRLYSGFRYEPTETSEEKRGILSASIAFNNVADILPDFHAKSIDNGLLWDKWGKQVDTKHRVDWTLLAALKELEGKLRGLGLERSQAHALIGKFVYLRYLRDRGILSDRKLEKWELSPEKIFSRQATMGAFKEVDAKLENWLNGSIFPIKWSAIRLEHLQLVAGVFSGDLPGGQLHLDFQPYDFSFIPIETLSVIYEQFLHAPDEGTLNRGRQEGAYYTPIPLVGYMLNEMESRRSLEEGMLVLDPSCGSGAFLVQCYRLLIEKKIKSSSNGLRLSELRDLLVKHIYGVDRDGDACQVAELSLILTLLDYTTPPDLENTPQFKLPTLHNKNIFQADFFDSESEWAKAGLEHKIDWLVGNPPWREGKASVPEDRTALSWMRQNAENYPIGGNQIAEAFLWRSLPLLSEESVAGLVLPSMTLFKNESTRFRAKLFRTVKAWCVTNFANLSYVLFGGRSNRPAMTLFFTPRPEADLDSAPDEFTVTFSPFLVNQRANRVTNRKKETWSVVVNGAEIRELPFLSLIEGDSQQWKLAMWGCFRDGKLLDRVAKKHPSMSEFANDNDLHIHQGFELRGTDAKEPIDAMPELAGQKQLLFTRLKNCGKIFCFPLHALSKIPHEEAFVRKGRGMTALKVSTPPHIIVDASRRFAVFSDEFIAIPARKIGISGKKTSARLLKAMSIYLSSEFCTYQQFLTTPEWGVSTSLATLDSLKHLPVPLDQLSDSELKEWAELQQELAFESSVGTPSESSLKEIDSRVNKVLGLRRSEQILVKDFVKWNMLMVKGRVVPAVIAPPEDDEIYSYLNTMKSDLDMFVGSESGLTHKIQCVKTENSAMLSIGLARGLAPKPILLNADNPTAKALAQVSEHLLRRHSQWLYFERSLKIYDGGRIYLYKPLEMIHWTCRQAILDAGGVIAETLQSQGH